jgi:hypothetical protein
VVASRSARRVGWSSATAGHGCAARPAPTFIDGSLPRWSPLALDVVLLGPSHEACRRLLEGAPLDPGWMRTHLPRWPGKASRRESVARDDPRSDTRIFNPHCEKPRSDGTTAHVPAKRR